MRRHATFLAALSGAVFLLSAACASEQEEAPATVTPLPIKVLSSPTAKPEGESGLARPDYVLQGLPEVAASFGYSLAAGDIDADGYDDVIVGAPWPEVTPGKVLAFLGGKDFSGGPDAILRDPEEDPSEGFGYFLAAGDVDGDKRAEVIVGKPLGRGRVFVFSDAAGSPGAASAILEDPEHRGGALLGYPVAVGDVNGDGYSDVIAGGPKLDVGQHPGAGAVFVFRGGDHPVFDSILHAPEPEAGAWFGRSVTAGDVNGDGLDDVIVGSYGSRVDGLDSAGKVFVFMSGDSLGQTSPYVLQDPAPQEKANLGYAVAAGDLDGDGYEEVIAGAFGSTVNRLFGAGKVLVFRGGRDFDVAPDAVLQAPEPEGSGGFAYVVAAADVNRDGFDDLIVGAPYMDMEGQDAAGKAFVFLGSPTPSYEAARTLVAPIPQKYAYFGVSIAAGDVDGNGIADLIIGAYGTKVDRKAGAGQALIFLSAAP